MMLFAIYILYLRDMVCVSKRRNKTMHKLFIIRVTTCDNRAIHSLYASTISELQTKFDAWRSSANGKAYSNQKITAYKYVDDNKVSERILQAA